MNSNFRDRKYHTFISHAHVDKEFVNQIYNFLIEAGMSIWYDSQTLNTSSNIVQDLPKKIEECKSMIFIISNASLESAWVKNEISQAILQQSQHKEFKILPIILEEVDYKKLGFLQTTKFIEKFKYPDFTKFYAELLFSFYNLDTSKFVVGSKDIYVSRSWRENELDKANEVSKFFIEKDFWLIGDSIENTSFSEERIMSIMRSCGGLLSIVPDRGDNTMPKYHKIELELAQKLGLPILIISDGEIEIPENISAKSINIKDLSIKQDTRFLNIFYDFSDDWIKPSESQYIFYATNLNEEFKERNHYVKKLIEVLTARECIMGEEIRTGHIQHNIIENIQNSYLVLADISENRLNTCIEVGIARGANKVLKLISKGPRESPPFMFRDLQVFHYDKDEEILAKVHKLLFSYKRRVINLEII